MSYITSTMSASVTYCVYAKTVGGLTKVVKEITINGGANVIDKHFVTKEGVCTEVSEEDLELLQQNRTFQQHLKNGFLKIQKRSGVDTKNLEKEDNSAQLTKAKFEKQGRKAPKTGKVE